MKIFTPVTADGQSGSHFGRAHWAAVAEVADGVVSDWQVHEISWDVLHDEGTHGSHHSRVARFFKEQGVEAVVAAEMGPGMVRMLTTMGLPILPASPGDAQASVLAAIEAGPITVAAPDPHELSLKAKPVAGC